MNSEPSFRSALSSNPLTSLVPENQHGWPAYIVLAFVAFNLLDFTIQTCVYLRMFSHFIGQKQKIVFRIFITAVFLVARIITGYLILLLIPNKLVYGIDFTAVIPPRILVTLCYGGLGIFIVFTLISHLSCLSLLAKGRLSPDQQVKGSEEKIEAAVPLPMVIILMPVYNEDPEALLTAVDSAIACDYPANKKHLFVSFDDDQESELYKRLAKHLEHETSGHVRTSFHCSEYVIRGVVVTVNRFPHGGKRETQTKSFDIIARLYGKEEDARVLFIDSDIILNTNAIHNFISNGTMATTGLITCRTSQGFNILQCLQDAEYLNDQVFIRSSEVLLGAATCLPGALTMTNLKSLQNVAATYFGELDIDKSVDFHRFHLGEDRFLTYLLLETAKNEDTVGFESSAQCKTDAPASFMALLKQRRRWFLGTASNDIAMLLSPEIWIRFPWVMVFKFFSYGTAGVNMLTWVACCVDVLIAGMSGMALNDSFFYIAMGIFAIRLILNAGAALKIHRKKVVLFGLIFIFINPIFVFIVVLYSIWTWGVRSWGGPRSENEEVCQC